MAGEQVCVVGWADSAGRTADGHGQSRLEALTLEDVRTGQREQVPAAAVFVMIGAEPRTRWRRVLVKLNDRGFVLTGRDVPPGAWPLPRPPRPFGTSLLGDQDAGCPEPGNLRATSRAGRSDRRK
jgi:thioredoxin reductase (NADPH)